MNMRKALLAVWIITAILAILLISLREYYIAITTAVGVVILTRRELWYLAKFRKVPPFDERVKENMGKAARNGFIFFAVGSAVLMLCFSINLAYVTNPNPIYVMSGLFLSGGLVYLLSYVFYDRVEPKLNEKESRKLKTFLQVAGIATGAGISSVILHNAVSAVFGFEEPVFFIIAIISPGAIAVGLIGSLVIFAKGLLRKQLPQTAD